ncbi:MAG: nucleotidyl transferase AbiEii/AbiGii toxin family protein [Chryseobacterium sp.]|nr:MAG: nucleotidyl transferase AbiEii/AbiGii toxin family protein [Chryseobacterium sp.]
MYWNTVSPLLQNVLMNLMREDLLSDFRLVGGTALSLHIGHRMSVDIDLFTDAPYRSVDFEAIEKKLKSTFEYVYGDFGGNPVMGKSYLIGTDKKNVIKVDIYYSMDPFFQDAVLIDGVRMASIEEIIAMKVDIIQRKGRKKDFWDLHELLEHYSIADMIELHQKRFEWTHEPMVIKKNFSNFSEADLDFDPICLKSKEWVFIKEDFENVNDK